MVLSEEVEDIIYATRLKLQTKVQNLNLKKKKESDIIIS